MLLRPALRGKPLSAPELDVLRAAADGLSAKETAEKLVKSQHTVIAQRRAVQAKLGARNLTHAIALAFQTRVLRPPESS
jgi:LuxR family quorum sensing-dependent transcriptional regulator